MSDATITGVIFEAPNILHTNGHDGQGNEGTSSLNLDSLIGNVNGALSWGGTNFSAGATNSVLSADGQTLEADLPDVNGQMVHSSINLGHEIIIDDGFLALRTSFDVPHSTAHAIADSNSQADQAVLAQAQTVGISPPVASITTTQGDASQYNPGDVGNPPAAGGYDGKIVVFLIVRAINAGRGTQKCVIL